MLHQGQYNLLNYSNPTLRTPAIQTPCQTKDPTLDPMENPYFLSKFDSLYADTH